MAVSFYIRNKKSETATLFARIRSRVKSIDIKTSTSIEIEVLAWENAHKSELRLKNFKNANKDLFDKLDKIEKAINNLLDSDAEISTENINKRIGEIIFAEQIAEEKVRKQTEEAERKAKEATNFNDFITQYISECETGKRKKKGGTLAISAGTVKSYKGFQSQFNEYQEKFFKEVDFKDVTMEFYNDFRSWMESKQYSPNTIARHIKICKTICYAAEQKKLIDASNIRTGFEVTYKDVDNVYLTMERIQELYEADFSNRPAWDKVRDVFIVGCLTGQRVSDYKRINAKMIEELTDGNKYIKIKQEKTNNIVFIPLDWRIEAILKKYDGNLPKVYDQKINDYIKDIGEYMKWTEIVEHEEQRGTMEYTVRKRFCDLLKTHTCRRSLATNMYKSGCSLSEIMAITGHNSEQQLKTYLKLKEEEKAMQAAKSSYFLKNQMRIAK